MAIDEHPFDRVVRLLRERGATIRQSRPGQIRATCPAHADRKPSLVVTRTDRGVLLNCFAGCRKGDPARALGLRPADLFTGPPPASHEKPTIVATYIYTNASGEAIARKVRTADKRFWWQHPDASAGKGWRKGLDAAADAPCLYRKLELERAPLVFIVEGEKGVDRLRALDLVATCGPAGASCWRGSDALLEAIASAAVIAILPDHDQAGERHAERVAADIFERRGDRSIVLKVVSLPELPPGGDVVDWLDAGHSRDELLNLVDASATWFLGAAEERRRLHRREVATERKRKWRATRMTSTHRSAPPQHADPVAAALEAILAELRRAGVPQSGRELKAALAGRHARDVMDAALRVGRAPGGPLVDDVGPRRARLYRVRTLERSSDIRRVTGAAGHSASVRTVKAKPDTQLAGFPEQNPVSECPVTLSRVTQGERSSLPLQDDPTSSLNTPRDTSPDTESGTQAPDTEGENRRDAESQRQAIASNRCCGKNGAELRCQLCCWSPTYLPVLRRQREAAPAVKLR